MIVASDLRNLYWSELCSNNLEAYSRYLISVRLAIEHGKLACAPGSVDGARRIAWGCRGVVDNDGGSLPAAGCGGSEEKSELEDSCPVASGSVGAKDNGACGACEAVLGVSGGWIPARGVGGGVSGVFHDGGDARARDVCGQVHSKADGGSVGPATLSKTQINRIKREKKKMRKARKKVAAAPGLCAGPEFTSSSDTGASSVPEWRRGAVGRNGKPLLDSPNGFWRSCSNDTRQKLIESKAAMHIAENERRAAEAKARVLFLASPQSAVQQAVKLTDYAKKLDSKGDAAIYGYARTVSSATAEGIVKSLPDSVTSYEDYERRKIESETSTLVESLRGKTSELNDKLASADEQRVKLEQQNEKYLRNAKLVAETVLKLEREVHDLKKEKEKFDPHRDFYRYKADMERKRNEQDIYYN